MNVDGAVGRVGRGASRARADDADERGPVGRVLRDAEPGHERDRNEASAHAREAAERPGRRANGGHRVRLRVWRLGGGQGAARDGGAASESAEQHAYESLFTATRCGAAAVMTALEQWCGVAVARPDGGARLRSTVNRSHASWKTTAAPRLAGRLHALVCCSWESLQATSQRGAFYPAPLA